MAVAEGRVDEKPSSALTSPGRSRAWRGVRSTDDWRTSLVVLLALLVTIPGLHTILVGTAWAVQLSLVCGLVLGAAAITRSVTRIAFMPPIVGAVAFLGAMTAFFAPDTAFLAVIPTTDTFAVFAQLLQKAALSIQQQTLPANADVGITFVMCLGIAAIALAADIAALVMRAPALVGIPLVVLLSVPPYIQPHSADPVTFVLAAVAFLVLLRIGSRRGQGGLSFGLGAAIVVISLVASFALPATVDQTGDSASGTFGTGVNPMLSLGNDLRQGTNRTVLTYSTNSGDAHYLRLVSIGDFAGTNWSPDLSVTNRKNTVASIAPAPGLSPAVKTVKGSTTVRVSTLTSRWLPLPYPTTGVKGLVGDWYWDSNGHAVSSTDRTSEGQQYTATDLRVAPSAEQLLATGSTVPAGLGRFLAVPKGLPGVIAQTARSAVAGATTNYEKAVLLQAYFRDGDFQYSETAPVAKGYDGTGGQVIAKFLKAKSGYCIHFASAMAMMARTLGIPARISVGFLPGHVVSGTGADRKYEVDSHDLHSWPELYFAGVGWTRFEPTVSRGDVPSYANGVDSSTTDPTVASGSNPGTSATRSAAPVVPATVVPTAGPVASGSASRATRSASWLWLMLIVIAAASLLPAAVRLIQRRRRLADGSVTAAWTEVVQSATDVGRPLSETMTPREAVARLAEGAPEAQAEQLALLLDSLERERFGRGAVLQRETTRDIRPVVAWLLASARPGTRIRAYLYPPSLWSRILRR
jgi:transglutaminase-like putative cysteine protease